MTWKSKVGALTGVSSCVGWGVACLLARTLDDDAPRGKTDLLNCDLACPCMGLAYIGGLERTSGES
jgi:hypothetical protein